jgi:ABC-2 type transport system permease protein
MLQKITAIAWKDTIIRFSSWSEFLFFLILPITFTVLLSGGLGGGQGEPVDARIALLVVREDASEPAEALLAALATSDAVRVMERERAEAEELFADEFASALLIVPQGFGEAVLAGKTAVLTLQQLPNNNNAVIAGRAVETAVGEISRPWLAAQNSLGEAEQIAPFADSTARMAYFQQGVQLAGAELDQAPTRLIITQPERALVEAVGWDQAAHQSAGQLITWVFIPLLGTSGIFAYERYKGTLRRLFVTPTRQATFLLGTIGGQYGAAIVQMAILVGFGMLVMGVNWGQSPLGLALVLLSFGLASVAFGVMLGTFIRTESQASNLSIMLGMSMALLGGCWFPLELFPPAAQTAAHVLPTTWAMQGLTDLVMRGGGVADVMLETAVLGGFAILFFVVGIGRFRYE